MTRRILVVDDEPGMLHAIQRVLGRSYELVCVSEAVEALDRASRFQPDLAILDVRMPGLDGFELSARLQQQQPGIDVILMTGSTSDADQKLIRAIRQGAFYFVQKPFDREVLRTLVERCLERRSLEEQSRAQLRRLEAELEEARQFQRSLLPPAEASIGPIRLAARWVPCTELGGDFYDYAPLPGGGLAFLLADVSGHGASAAMMTGVVKSAFQSCHREGYDPAAVVERIAAGIQRFDLHRFVTAICGRLHVAAGTLEYVNAGHPPALVWDAALGLRRLEPTGPLISPAVDLPWERPHVPVAPGDSLLLYTDGIIEASGPAGQFGEERIEREIRRAPQGGAALVDALLEAVTRFAAGRPLDDDLSLLTLRLTEL